MREKKWTKGPWKAFPFKKSIFIEDKGGDVDVAEIDKDSANADANARLIAAAPDLVEALEAARDFLVDFGACCNPDCTDCIKVPDIVLTALAKAYGEGE